MPDRPAQRIAGTRAHPCLPGVEHEAQRGRAMKFILTEPPPQTRGLVPVGPNRDEGEGLRRQRARRLGVAAYSLCSLTFFLRLGLVRVADRLVGPGVLSVFVIVF